MWGPVSKALQRAGSCTLMCDYRNGTPLDYSGLNRTGVITAPVQLSRQGAQFSGVGRITHPDHALGRNTTGSIVMLCNTTTSVIGSTGPIWFDSGDAGGNRIRLYAENGAAQIRVIAGGSTVFITTTIFGRRCFAVNYYNDGITFPTIFVDGLSKGVMSAVCTPVAYASAITIGNRYNGGFPNLTYFSTVCETNIPLTAAQHLAVYQEMQAQILPMVPTRRYWRGNVLTGREPGLLASFDLANAGGVCFDKTGGKNGVVTGTTPDQGPGHMAALRFNGTSDKIVTTTTYLGNAPRTISFWAKSNHAGVNVCFTHGAGDRIGAFYFYYGGSFRPMLYLSGTEFRYWTSVSQQTDNNWHHWVLTINLGVEDSVLYCDGVAQTVVTTTGTGYGTAWTSLNIGYRTIPSSFSGSLSDFRVFNYAMTQAQVTQFRANTYSPLQLASADWGCPVSAAAEGGVANTELGRTGWRFGTTTPRYWVDTSTVEGKTVKTLRCSTSGPLCRPTLFLGQTPQEAAYGEWRFRTNLAASGLNIQFGNNDKVYSDASFNGYLIQFVGTSVCYAWKVTGGVVSSKFASSTVFATGIWYDVKIKRSAVGVWEIWVKGGALPAWTLLPAAAGANPFTENTYTEFGFVSIGSFIGTLVSLGDVTGNLGLTHSVLTP